MLLFQKIAGLKNDDNFSQEDNTILSEVIENHKNLIQKKIIPNKFVINKQEINEIKSIENNNLPRYLIYRYKYRFFSKDKRIFVDMKAHLAMPAKGKVPNSLQSLYKKNIFWIWLKFD